VAAVLNPSTPAGTSSRVKAQKLRPCQASPKLSGIGKNGRDKRQVGSFRRKRLDFWLAQNSEG